MRIIRNSVTLSTMALAALVAWAAPARAQDAVTGTLGGEGYGEYPGYDIGTAVGGFTPGYGDYTVGLGTYGYGPGGEFGPGYGPGTYGSDFGYGPGYGPPAGTARPGPGYGPYSYGPGMSGTGLGSAIYNDWYNVGDWYDSTDVYNADAPYAGLGYAEDYYDRDEDVADRTDAYEDDADELGDFEDLDEDDADGREAPEGYVDEDDDYVEEGADGEEIGGPIGTGYRYRGYYTDEWYENAGSYEEWVDAID